MNRKIRWLLPLLGAAQLFGCKNIEEGQAAPGTVGASCASEGDCTSVQPEDGNQPVCLKQPGGYCSVECAGSSLFACDDQSICHQLGDRASFCMDGCLTENGNGDCRGEYRCEARPDVSNADGREVGVCLPKCQADNECPTGRRCSEGTCVARGQKATGEACSSNGPCNGGLCLKNDTFRGGYCSARCGDQFSQCEPGSFCHTLDGSPVCLAECGGDGDCRANEGYKCRQIASRKNRDGDDVAVRVCVPKCQSNDECGDGTHCDVASGDCVEGVGEPNPVGAFCSGDGDCASGTCFADAGWPNGYCTSDCGDDTECGDGVCGGGKCLAACQADLDCRGGYFCLNGGCVGRCADDADCGGELTCNTRTGRCGAGGAGAASVEEVQVADGVSVAGQLSRELSLQVPEGAQSFAILASGAGNNLMIIGEMRDPSGRKLYDFQDPFGSSVRFFPSEDVITQYVPSSPRTAPVPGTYKFRLIKEGPATNVDVTALIKTSQGETSTGTLDVNFFFANLGGLDAASAQTNAKFQSAVETMRDVYAQQGITLGEVHYCDIPGADADRYAVIDDVDGPGSELSRMFKLSGNAATFGCSEGRALNFFMVQEIVGGRAGYIILGIAGGIPGPPGLHGTTHSGVAVTMVNFERDPKQLALTMAHEGGHFLGLFHTTEAEGTAFDPLEDTAECSNSSDRDGDGVVSYQECGGRGAENLMFWAAGDDAEQVTGDQGFVVVRNPALQ